MGRTCAGALIIFSDALYYLSYHGWWTRGELNPGLGDAIVACYLYTTGPMPLIGIEPIFPR